MISKTPILLSQAARTTLVAAASLSFLSACAVGPDVVRPVPPPSQHYDAQAEQRLSGSGGTAGAPRIAFGQKVDGDWWSAFQSTKLDQVMRKAVGGNLDLVTADATIAQANEAIAAAKGALYPQADFASWGGRERAVSGDIVTTSDFYAVGPQVSFDFDVFGGNKRRIEAQAALADLQRHRYDAAHLTLTGNVADQALLLASAHAQIDAVQVLLEQDRKTLDLVRTGHRFGSATQVDVALATTQLEQDQTLLPPLAQQRDTARHALSVLAGKGPADWAPPDFELADFVLPANLPVSLPSEMARDRPDILEAEARYRAAGAEVGVATADLYPHLQLSASLAAAGPGIGSLWSIAGGLTAPIFHGGTLQAYRRASVDGYRASLAIYQQTVVHSLGQVANVLQAINHDAEESAAQDRALGAAEASLRLNQAGFRAGEIDILQVLDAQRAYQRALLGQIRARTAQYLDTVQLSVALGGGSAGAFARTGASTHAG